MYKELDWNDALPRPSEWDRTDDDVAELNPPAAEQEFTAVESSPQQSGSPLGPLKAFCATSPVELDKLIPLASVPNALRETENPAALFRNGWLRKGGGAFLTAPSGIGKSVFTIQAPICWAMGRAALGVEPVRPLKIAIIQAEDDDDEVADFRNNARMGLIEAGFDASEVDKALAEGVFILSMVGATGGSFIDRVQNLLAAYPEIDLLIINPFQSYFGGDCSRNNELTEFLRVKLDPIIKPGNVGRVGVLFVHHTNKPPPSKDQVGWGIDQFSAYIGAGGAEIVNWARAVLAIMPIKEAPGFFRFVGAKRGNRLGWITGEGKKTNQRVIAHHPDLIFWREPTEDEVAEMESGGEVTGKSASYGDKVKDASQLAESLRTTAASAADARKRATGLFNKNRGERAFDYLKGNLATHMLHMANARCNGAVFIGMETAAEALKTAYDTACDLEQARKAAKKGS